MSGFIFTEDTFCNDLSDPDNLDCSHLFREWAGSCELGPF